MNSLSLKIFQSKKKTLHKCLLLVGLSSAQSAQDLSGKDVAWEVFEGQSLNFLSFLSSSGSQWKMGVFERWAEVWARPSLTFFYSSVSAVKYSEDFIFSNSFPKEVLGVPTLSWRPLTVFFWHWGKYESMRLGSFGFIVAGWESGQCFMKIFYSFVFFILFCKRKLENVKVCSVGSFGAMERFYGVKPPLPAIEVWNHTLGK